MAIARPVSALLTQVIDAHGGMARWCHREKVEATIVSGGGFFPLKGVIQDSKPRRMTVWLHEERSSVLPYGAPDQRTMFTPDRIAIEKLDGTVVAERRDPRDSVRCALRREDFPRLENQCGKFALALIIHCNGLRSSR